MVKKHGKPYKEIRSKRKRKTHRWRGLRISSHAKNTIVYKSIRDPNSGQKRKGKSEDRRSATAKNYYVYIQSSQWKQRRAKFLVWLRRRNHGKLRCRDCKKKLTKKNRQAFNVHHESYERLGKELNKDLSLLCHRCHRKRHGLERTHDIQRHSSIRS